MGAEQVSASLAALRARVEERRRRTAAAEPVLAGLRHAAATQQPGLMYAPAALRLHVLLTELDRQPARVRETLLARLAEAVLESELRRAHHPLAGGTRRGLEAIEDAEYEIAMTVGASAGEGS